MKVSAQYAQEHLTDLLDTAERGGEVEITRPDNSSYRLTLVSPPPPRQQQGKRILGAGRGKMRVPSWEEWQAMDDELARQMNRPLFPPEDQ
jgi:antitoxin (DNA-binding transcriptional repressor) of toxin-antitoxin stability system